jgi:hypothetical protein
MSLSATRRRTGRFLLGHVDRAEAALADFLEDLVRPDLLGSFFEGGGKRRGETLPPRSRTGEERAGAVGRVEQ